MPGCAVIATVCSSSDLFEILMPEQGTLFTDNNDYIYHYENLEKALGALYTTTVTTPEL